MPIAPSSIRRASRIIAMSDDASFNALLPNLTETRLSFAQILCSPNQPIETIYFPIDAVCSILIETGDQRVEVGLIGNEGLTGGTLMLGIETVPFTVVCHVSGRALKIDAAAFKRSVQQSVALSKNIERYLQALFYQVAHHAACAKVHLVEERFALWVLMIQDRVQKEDFYLTQALISEMMSVRRESISRIASTFHRMGLISYNRGNLSIRNRSGLKNVTCECYGKIKEDYDQLLPI